MIRSRRLYLFTAYQKNITPLSLQQQCQRSALDNLVQWRIEAETTLKYHRYKTSSNQSRVAKQSKYRQKRDGRSAACHYCLKKGHHKSECWSLKNGSRNSRSQYTSQVCRMGHTTPKHLLLPDRIWKTGVP